MNYSIEPDKLKWYMALKGWCTEIYPHYKDMYPCAVKNITALDRELSKEAWEYKKNGSRKSLKDFWKCSLSLHPQQAIYSLQFHTLNIPPQEGQCCATCFSKATCTDDIPSYIAGWLECCRMKSTEFSESSLKVFFTIQNTHWWIGLL